MTRKSRSASWAKQSFIFLTPFLISHTTSQFGKSALISLRSTAVILQRKLEERTRGSGWKISATENFVIEIQDCGVEIEAETLGSNQKERGNFAPILAAVMVPPSQNLNLDITAISGICG